MNSTTKIIIALVVAAVAAIGIYMYQKSKNSLATPVASDPFDVDDTAAYNSVLSKMEPYGNHEAWVNPYVIKEYQKGTYKINGKPSKTETLVQMLGRFAPNKDGKFVNARAQKVLWPQEFFNDIWDNDLNPLKAKYNRL